MTSEEKVLILDAARILYEVLQGKRKVACTENDILFIGNGFGVAIFDIDGNLFEVRVKSGEFSFVEAFTLIDEERCDPEWFFPDDVVRQVLGWPEMEKLQKIFKQAAKNK